MMVRTDAFPGLTPFRALPVTQHLYPHRNLLRRSCDLHSTDEETEAQTGPATGLFAQLCHLRGRTDLRLIHLLTGIHPRSV